MSPDPSGARGVELRRLSSADLPALGASLGPEVPELELTTSDLHRNLQGDPDFDPGLLLAAWDRGALVGAACGVLRGEQGGSDRRSAEGFARRGVGHLKLIVVAAPSRRRGVGSLLCARLTDLLARRGAVSVETDGAAPCYLLPGVPVGKREGIAFLQARGFAPVETRRSMTADLGVRLEEGEAERRAEGRGYVLRRATLRDEDELVRSVASAFPGPWAVELSLALRAGDAVVETAWRGPALAGFAASGLWARNAFGPMGTLPGHEGRGVGAALLLRCLRALRDSGQRRVVISWVGPESFYERHAGAKTTLEYRVLRREL